LGINFRIVEAKKQQQQKYANQLKVVKPESGQN
jgi:hypothetical protein